MSDNGSNRVIRGGSWNNNAQNCRSANRNNNSPGNRNNNVGFRLVSTRNTVRFGLFTDRLRVLFCVQTICPAPVMPDK